MKFIIEQEEEWVRMSPKEYLELLEYASYNAKGISRLPKFRGKKIYITGNLSVKGKPINSLEGIGYIDGYLDISQTNISDISHITVKSYVSDHDTPIDRLRKKRIRDKQLADAADRRESNEWSLSNDEIDDIGLAANAVIGVLGNDYGVDVKDEEDFKRLEELNRKMEELLNQEKQKEGETDLSEIHSEIEVTEKEINEINEMIDVYHLIPQMYDFFGMPQFKVIGGREDGAEFAAGTESEVEEACKESLQEWVDNPKTYFNEEFLKQFIDRDAVLDTLRETFEQDMWDSPESYFNDEDYALTEEQEEEVEMYQAQIRELEERQKRLKNEIKNPDEYSKAWDDVQMQIDDLEEKISEIEPDRNEPTQEMVDDKVGELLDDANHNIVNYMENYGMDIQHYLDKDEIVRHIMDNDSYGQILNSYDGSENIIYIDKILFYVFKVG